MRSQDFSTKFLSPLVLGWGIFSLLNLLLNSQWWLWNLFSMVPTFLWLLICITMVVAAWRTRRRSLLLISVVSLLLWVPFIDLQLIPNNIFSGNASSQVIQDESVKVFTWNTEVWDSYDDSEQFISFLKEQEADVYHLQERFNGDLQIIDVSTQLRQHFPEYNIVQEGDLVTLTRFPIVKKSYSTAYDLWQGYLRVDMKVNDDKTVSFYNIHLPVPVQPRVFSAGYGSFSSSTQGLFKARQSQFIQLYQDIGRNKLPKVISGDFNSTTFESYMSQLSSYKDAYNQTSVGIPTTFKFGGLQMWRIDWLFVSPDLEVINFKQLDPGTMSDHQGLLVILAT